MYRPKIAYAIWPWGLDTKEQMVQALKDIKSVGYSKFESVRNAIDVFKGNAKEFKDVTDEYGVHPVSFYFHQTGDENTDVKEVETKVEFLVANGVYRMSVQAPGLTGRPASHEELRLVLRTIERISKITKKYGIVPCVHPHNNTMIMYENEIDFIMQNTDPDYVALGPDTAHLVLGKCDPLKIFKKYIKRIKFLHLKDIMKNTQVNIVNENIDKGFEVYSDFLELGKGNVDFKPIFDLLSDIGYDGYMCAELDNSRFGNKESAEMNLKYLRKHFDDLEL